MGEGNHTASNQSLKPKFVMIGAGTAVALLAGAILFQIYRADTAPAAEQPGTQQTAAPPAKTGWNQPASRITSGPNKTVFITQEELARECVQRVGEEVLESMINRSIIQIACEEKGISITLDEIDKEIDDIAKQFKIPRDTWLQMLHAERNLTPLQYRRDVIWPMLALRKLTGENVEVAQKDLQEAFLHHYGPRVKARMIMLDNFRRANTVWEEAQAKPEEFGRLAREHSVDPNSRPLDGSIPPIPRFSGNKELEDTAFRLKEGEVSGIVQIGTPARYVILKCEGFTEQIVTDINEVKDQLAEDIRRQKVQEQVAKVFETLKARTRVDNYLTGTTTGGDKIQQTSATGSGGTAQPANATSAAGTYPRQAVQPGSNPSQRR